MKIKSILKTSSQYLAAIMCGVFFSFLIMKIFCPIYVSGISMYPTYYNGQFVSGEKVKNYNDLSIDDVITFKINKLPLIKRVVGLSGDRLIIKEHILYINDIPQYSYSLINDAGLLNEEYTVAEDEIFCLGDNINNSSDSRFIGPIKFENIDYRVKNGKEFFSATHH